MLWRNAEFSTELRHFQNATSQQFKEKVYSKRQREKIDRDKLTGNFWYILIILNLKLFGVSNKFLQNHDLYSDQQQIVELNLEYLPKNEIIKKILGLFSINKFEIEIKSKYFLQTAPFSCCPLETCIFTNFSFNIW